jgi:type II secretory pathway predicted ATPase ExeA
MPATAHQFINRKAQGAPYMPLNLKGVLARHNLSQTEWGQALTQGGGHYAGKSLSKTSCSLLLNYGRWPAATERSSIEEQTRAFLRAHQVPEAEIASIWESGDEVGYGNVLHLAAANEKPRVRGGAGSSNRVQFETDLPEVEMLSHAARNHFKLFRDPFIDDVQGPDDVYLSAEQRYIREAMFTTAKHGGFLAVIGESGAGKTILRRDLIDRVQREHHPITLIQPRTIDKGRLSASSICEAIIRDVSGETPCQSLEAKARQIERLLTGSSRAGNAHALLIEEAHDLSIQTLKYLKRFWELEDGFKKLLAILLVGQPELKAKLDERQNWEAREVIRRCEIAELRPLNGDLEEYLALKFKRLGKPLDDIFDARAYDAIRERLTLRRRGSDESVSMHYPLVVNNTVVKCMNLAAAIGAPKVTADLVREI